MMFSIQLHLFIVASYSAEIMSQAHDEKLFYRDINWKFIYGNYIDYMSTSKRDPS